MASDLPVATFAHVLREGIRARGLSLERLKDHLRQRGVRVSVATLSYWQSGRSLPERRESLVAIASLEQILGLPAGELMALLPPPRPRGRIPRQARLRDLSWPNPDLLRAALAQVDTSSDGQLTRLSVHDRVRLDQHRVTRFLRTRQVLRAERDGVDRLIVAFGTDRPGEPLPQLCIRPPASLGKLVIDTGAGLFVAELHFDHPLDRGETVIAEHLLVHKPPGSLSRHWERHFRHPVREYLLEVTFHPLALPARCVQYTATTGPERLRTVIPDNACSVHHVALGVQPGRCGIRWQWTA